MKPSEYRFVCVDPQGVWQSITYGQFAGDPAAKAHAADLAPACAYVLVWNGARRIGLVASLSRRVEYFPAA